jgi:hypothetical protein
MCLGCNYCFAKLSKRNQLILQMDWNPYLIWYAINQRNLNELMCIEVWDPAKDMMLEKNYSIKKF